jgi:hypothetical protein
VRQSRTRALSHPAPTLPSNPYAARIAGRRGTCPGPGDHAMRRQGSLCRGKAASQTVAARALPSGSQARTARLTRGHGERCRQPLQRPGGHPPSHRRCPFCADENPASSRTARSSPSTPLSKAATRRVLTQRTGGLAPWRRRPSDGASIVIRRAGDPVAPARSTSTKPSPGVSAAREVRHDSQNRALLIERIKQTVLGLSFVAFQIPHLGGLVISQAMGPLRSSTIGHAKSLSRP